MTSAAYLVNIAFTAAFDVICWPFQALAPIWPMVVISWLTGIVAVWIFGKVSDQKTIREVRDTIRGNLLAVRLFQHDVAVVLKLQGRIVRDTMIYMKHALMPMVVLLVPILIVMIQLNLRFSVRPLHPGEPALVKAQVRDSAVLQDEVFLDTSDGLTVETPAVRIPSEQEVVWRIRADEPGYHALVVRVGGESAEKELIVASDGWAAVSELRTGRNLWDMLLYPGEAPIEATHVVQEVAITYPAQNLGVFGWNIDWLVWFFVLSLAFGFAFKGMLGVEI